MPRLVLVTLCVLALFALTGALEPMSRMEAIKLIYEVAPGCVKETGISIENMAIFEDKSQWANLKEDQLCYMKCMGEKLQQIDSDGKICLESGKHLKNALDGQGKYDEYFKCIEKIEFIKECNDIKKMLECDLDFS